MPQNPDVLDPLRGVKELVSRTRAASDTIHNVCEEIVRLALVVAKPGEPLMSRDEIADSAEFLNYMLDVSPVFAVELIEGIDDPVIVRASKSLEEMFGYTAGQLIGLPVSALIPSDKRIQHKAWVLDFLKHPVDRQMGNLGNIEPEGLDLTGNRFPIVLMWKRFYLERRQFLAGTVMRQVQRQKTTEQKA